MQRFAEAAFNNEKERKAWFKIARKDLKNGKILDLLEQMKQKRKSISGSRRKILTSQINYFNKPLYQGKFNYDNPHPAAPQMKHARNRQIGMKRGKRNRIFLVE